MPSQPLGGSAYSSSSRGLDLDRLEAHLTSKTGSASGASGTANSAAAAGSKKPSHSLKWLKDTSADRGPQMGVADAQRALLRGEAAEGSGGAPEMSPSVHVKLPVLKSLRNATGGVDVSSRQLGGANQPVMIEVLLNDRLGKKVRVKVNSNDTIGDLKKLAAAQLGTRADKIRLQKWYNVYKDHVTLDDYEVHDGSNLELYYM